MLAGGGARSLEGPESTGGGSLLPLLELLLLKSLLLPLSDLPRRVLLRRNG